MDDRFAALRNTTAAALLRGEGHTPVALREAVADGNPPAELSDLVDKIRMRAVTVTDQDIDALRDRYTEDQLFEIILAATFGAARQQLARARRALVDA